MKAVFIHQASLLRDSDIDLADPAPDWKLMPATIEAVRLLGSDEVLILLFCAVNERKGQEEDQPAYQVLMETAKQLQAGGGRVDAAIRCKGTPADGPHRDTYPGLVWSAVARLGLQPESCYLLADTLDDVFTAREAGVRPIVILGDRSIEQVFGRADLERDFPVAADLITAVQYIQVEEDIARQIGSSREEPVAVPSDLLLPANIDRLASMTLLSPLARELAEQTGRTRVQRTDIARWLFFLTFGALGLSLGIAYLLTHLYRVQPFPEFVYYLTLQFIPRPVRGLLFILVGLGVIAFAVKSIMRSAAIREWVSGARRIRR